MNTKNALFAILIVALVFLAGVGIDLVRDVPVAYAASGSSAEASAQAADVLAAGHSEGNSLSSAAPAIQIAVGLVLIFFIAIAVLPLVVHGEIGLDQRYKL